MSEQAGERASELQRASFEADYRKTFPTVISLRDKFKRDELGDYEEGAVFVAFEMWKAGRASLAAQTVPEGWKLVPHAITPEMIRAALAVQWPSLYRDAIYNSTDSGNLQIETRKRVERIIDQYDVMIAAAPTGDEPK
jgi:hypothetical protein